MQNTGDFYYSETILHDTAMVDMYHDSFVTKSTEGTTQIMGPNINYEP